MHFFYGIKNDLFKSELQIPLFENRKFFLENNHLLCKCFIKDDKWQFLKIKNEKIESKFFIIKNDDFTNDEFFFLINKENYNLLNDKELVSVDRFPVRANFKIYIDKGGFSSYQSEYPYGMVQKKGNVTSAIGSLSNKDAEKNFILFRNIYKNPIKEKFKSYLVDIKTNKKVHEYDMWTNTSNLVELHRSFIKPEIYFISDQYIGIPSFVSVKNKHISFEHTHPPHAYILNSKKFYLVNKLKDKINEIIH